jgi:hypothetical protein
LPLEEVVDPNNESDDDERGILLLSPRPEEETEYSLEDDSFAEESLPLACSEDELEASREEDDT